MRSSGRALIKTGWCPYTKRPQSSLSGKDSGKGWPSANQKKIPTTDQPWSGTYSTQYHEKINLRCLSYWVWSIFLRQPNQTKARSQCNLTHIINMNSELVDFHDCDCFHHTVYDFTARLFGRYFSYLEIKDSHDFQGKGKNWLNNPKTFLNWIHLKQFLYPVFEETNELL